MKKNGNIAGDSADAAFRAFVRASGLVRRVMEPFFSRFGVSGRSGGS